jgi:predicted ATPase
VGHRATDDRLLVGRAGELEILRRCLENAWRDSSTLVLISGEPGIGKTSLASAFGEQARSAGSSFATGCCFELGVIPAFGPWHGLLEQRQTNGMLTLAALPPPFGHGPPAWTAFQLMQAVLLLLRAATSARPLVLLLDYLHWADPHSLELLDLVTRGLDNLPLQIIVTYWTSDIPTTRRSTPICRVSSAITRSKPSSSRSSAWPTSRRWSNQTMGSAVQI